MAIFPGDKIIINGQLVTKPVQDDDVIYLNYRIAASITQGGKTYKFTGMVGDKAEYTRQSGAPVERTEPHRERPRELRTPKMSAPEAETPELPPGAVLSPDFIGGVWNKDGKRYRMMQPTRQVNGQFVYVPVG